MTRRVPSYWRFDAMAAYKVTKNFKLQLNVYNLTDEYYFDYARRRRLRRTGSGPLRIAVGTRVVLTLSMRTSEPAPRRVPAHAF